MVHLELDCSVRGRGRGRWCGKCSTNHLPLMGSRGWASTFLLHAKYVVCLLDLQRLRRHSQGRGSEVVGAVAAEVVAEDMYG